MRECYRAGRLPGVPPVSSNEPIGPGSSVASESDPIKLCSAAAFAWIANLPAYVFHSSAFQGDNSGSAGGGTTGAVCSTVKGREQG